MKIYFYTGETMESTWNCPLHEDAIQGCNMSPATYQLWNMPEKDMAEPQLVKWVDSRLKVEDNPTNYVFRSTSSILFHTIRAITKEGWLEPEDVFIRFLDANGKLHELTLNRHAKVNDWPDGFFDTYSRLLDILL